MNTIHIDKIQSIGIRAEMQRIGATKAEFLGSGEWESGNPNTQCNFFSIVNPANGFEFRVADTNGDPVWEEENYGAFAELAESCGLDL